MLNLVYLIYLSDNVSFTFQVAQALSKVGAVTGVDEVMPCLLRLLKDTDSDVRYYAAESIESLAQEKTKDVSENNVDVTTESAVVSTP